MTSNSIDSSKKIAVSMKRIIDVAFGSRVEALKIDTGIVDPMGENGLDLDAALWDQLHASGHFSNLRYRHRRDASGFMSLCPSGRITVQLVEPLSWLPVGPIAEVYASRCPRGVPRRVGVEFFHRLVGCSVNWDLDSRMWCVDYPGSAIEN